MRLSSALLNIRAQQEHSLKNFPGMWLPVKLKVKRELESTGSAKETTGYITVNALFQGERGYLSEIRPLRLSGTFRFAGSITYWPHLCQMIKAREPVSAKLLCRTEGHLQPCANRYLLNAFDGHTLKSRKKLFESPNKCFLSPENS